jgi:hypothetical protein
MYCAPAETRSSRPLSRRALLRAAAGLAPLTLFGCTGVPHAREDAAAMLHVLGRKRVREIPRSEVAKYAAASLQIQLGNGAAGLLLLRSVQGRDRLWQSSDNILIVTRGGRLMQTGGFKHDLEETTLLTHDPADGALLKSDGVKCIRTLAYAEEGEARSTRIEAISRFEVVGPRTLEILGVTTPTMYVREHVYTREIVWRYRNEYWADLHSPTVWKSRQHIYPDYPPLTITTLRQVAADNG